MTYTKEDWLVDHINYMVHEVNLNMIVLATGPMGSGKSWSMLRLAERTDPRFNPSRICFPAADFLETVTDRRLPQESAVVWDEIGVAMPARRWWDAVNQSAGYVMQSFRFRRLKSYLTLADPSMIDSVPRRLYQIHLSFYPRMAKDAPAIARIYFMRHDTRTGKPYYNFPHVKTDQGSPDIRDIVFQKPSDGILEKYQPKKEAYLYDLWEALIARVRDTERLGVDEGKVRLLLAFDEVSSELGHSQETKAKRLGLRRETYNRQLAKARKFNQPPVVNPIGSAAGV